MRNMNNLGQSVCPAGESYRGGDGIHLLEETHNATHRALTPDSRTWSTARAATVNPAIRSEMGHQKTSFSDNWIIRGLESKLTLRPKSPGLRILPLVSNESAALMSLMGLLRLGWFSALKKSARSSKFLDSFTGKRLAIERSTLLCDGPRSTLRPRLPMSFPPSGASAVGSCTLIRT